MLIGGPYHLSRLFREIITNVPDMTVNPHVVNLDICTSDQLSQFERNNTRITYYGFRIRI